MYFVQMKCFRAFAATFVGGGFIVGLTEAVYTPTMGLVWAVMPLTAAVSFIVGKAPFRHVNYGVLYVYFQYGVTDEGQLNATTGEIM